MRVIKEVSEHEVFIAEDGKKFPSEKECVKHENDLRIEREKLLVQELVKSLPHHQISVPEEDDFYTTDWYYIKNREELETLYRWFELENPEEYSAPVKLPGWVRITTSDDGDCDVKGTLEDYLSEVENFAALFEDPDDEE